MNCALREIFIKPKMVHITYIILFPTVATSLASVKYCGEPVFWLAYFYPCNELIANAARLKIVEFAFCFCFISGRTRYFAHRITTFQNFKIFL